MFTAEAHENSVWLPFQSFRLHAEALTSRERQVVLSMRLQKYLSHPSSVNYIFPTSPTKLKLRLANRCKTTISKPPEPIILIGQSEIGRSSQITFVTLFSGKC